MSEWGLFPKMSPTRQEAFNFARAEKVRSDAWAGGAVWSSEAARAFTKINSLRLWYTEHNRPLPAYVWECEREEADIEASARIAADSIAVHLDDISYDASEDLNERIEGWPAAHDIRLLRWTKGNKRAVVL